MPSNKLRIPQFYCKVSKLFLSSKKRSDLHTQATPSDNKKTMSVSQILIDAFALLPLRGSSHKAL